MIEAHSPKPGKNRRECPAVNGVITKAECGSKRGSYIDCPAHCPHYPFGTAGQELWLNVDQKWMKKVSGFIRDIYGSVTFRQLVEKGHVRKAREALAMEAAFYYAVYYGLVFHRDVDGRTVAEEWEAENWRGLNNDERVMMQYRRFAYPSVVEVQKVLDHGRLECIDLLEPEGKPFVVLDNSLAASAIRFTRLLTWITHYPHFTHIGPIGFEVNHVIWQTWKDRLLEDHQTACEEESPCQLKEYLAEHFTQFAEALQDLLEDHRRSLFLNLNLHQCMATFALSGSADDVESIISEKPDFRTAEYEPTPGFSKPNSFYHWIGQGESEEIAKRFPDRFRSDGSTADQLLGQLWLYDRALIVVTFSKKHFDSAKEMAVRYFGKVVRFEKETIVDLGKMMLEEQAHAQTVEAATNEIYADVDYMDSPKEQSGDLKPTSDEAIDEATTAEDLLEAIGPSDQAAPTSTTESLRQRYENFIEKEVSALDNQTPRQAAADAGMRPKLVELMKAHLYQLDMDNRIGGTDFDIDWILDELGLDELK